MSNDPIARALLLAPTLLALLALSCQTDDRSSAGGQESGAREASAPVAGDDSDPAPGHAPGQAPDEAPEGLAVATFAGGCFWCMEKPFEVLPGVRSVISGYTDGHTEEPTYYEVGSGKTGHAEAVQVTYDPAKVSYEDLLQVYWRQVDPTDPGGQFADRGPVYRTAIFVHDDDQRRLAEASKKALAASDRFSKEIVVPIEPASKFWPAEDYHQDYYEKEKADYERYRRGSGRAGFLERTWGDDAVWEPKGPAANAKATTSWRDFSKPSEEVLRERLTAMQFDVTQEDGTERAFTGEYWDNKQAGIYVDVVSGEPLFSSQHKYRSGTGWPSFWKPLVDDRITERTDHHLGYPRTEVRSKLADSHLGHVFEDGPEPTGLRYCINSAALRFVPVADLEEEGYGEFAGDFQ